MQAATASGVENVDARPATVLLVEDDVLLRLWIADELRREGFSVVEASHADEAMLILNSSVDLDLVMTDVRMPGSMDGLQLAALIRTRWPDLKLIVASGEPAGPAMLVADAFLPKPLDAANVIARIRNLLGATH